MAINTENLQIEEDILFITTGKYKLFLSHGKVGMDACLLYMHFMFTCRLQQTNSIWANDVYVRQGLNWTRPKLQKAKNLLLDLDLISTKRTRNEDGTLGKTYVIVKTKTSMLEFKENHVYDNQQVDKPAGGNRTTNALTKKEMLKQIKKEGSDKSPSLFTKLTEQYFSHYTNLFSGKKPLFEGKQRGIIKKIEERLKDHPDPINAFHRKLDILERRYKKGTYNGFTIEICCAVWDELEPLPLNIAEKRC